MVEWREMKDFARCIVAAQGSGKLLPQRPFHCSSKAVIRLTVK